MTPSILLMIFALSWELVAGGALHNMDARVFRMVYQATWWAPGILLCCASVVSVVGSGTWLQRAASVAAVGAATGTFAFGYPSEEKRRFSEPVRALRITDSQRRHRAPLLVISSALIVVAATLPTGA